MIRAAFYFYFVLSVLFFTVSCQEYDFAAEISRQCLVPDPVGLLDCVENKVTLPYLTSWVDCTNSLGQNVKTSADIINYRCKSVWEGKGVIPEVFYIKDCVIEKTGLPAKNVSAEVLGAYKECESTSSPPSQSVKTAPVQQQLRSSSVEYKPQNQQIQSPVFRPPQQTIQIQKPITQIQAPRLPPFQQVAQVQTPIQQIRTPVFQPPQSQLQVQRTVQQLQAPFSNPQQPFQMQMPFQQTQPALIRPLQQMQVPFQQSQAPRSFQTQTSGQQFGSPAVRPLQPQYQPSILQRPVQQQISLTAPVQQTQARPAQINQQPITAAFRPQYSSPASRPQSTAFTSPSMRSQPYSQQFFTLYPQAPQPNQQQNVNRAILSQKTVPNHLTQQLVSASTQGSSAILNAPYSYSFQIHHPQQPTF